MCKASLIMDDNYCPGCEGCAELIQRAKQVALEHGSIGVSELQRLLGVGYTHGCRIIEQLVRDGFLGDLIPGTGRRAVRTDAIDQRR